MNHEDLRQIDELLEKRFAEQDDKFEKRFEQIDRRFEQVDDRIDRLQNWTRERFAEQDYRIERGFAQQTLQINKLAKRIDEMEDSFEALVDRKIHEQQLWFENRMEPYMDALKDYIPSAGKTYQTLESQVAELKIRSIDHESAIKTIVNRLDHLEQNRQVSGIELG